MLFLLTCCWQLVVPQGQLRRGCCIRCVKCCRQHRGGSVHRTGDLSCHMHVWGEGQISGYSLVPRTHQGIGRSLLQREAAALEPGPHHLQRGITFCALVWSAAARKRRRRTPSLLLAQPGPAACQDAEISCLLSYPPWAAATLEGHCSVPLHPHYQGLMPWRCF